MKQIGEKLYQAYANRGIILDENHVLIEVPYGKGNKQKKYYVDEESKQVFLVIDGYQTTKQQKLVHLRPITNQSLIEKIIKNKKDSHLFAEKEKASSLDQIAENNSNHHH